MSKLLNYRNISRINMILLALLLASIGASLWASFEVSQLNGFRHTSLEGIVELQKNSDDLTRLARLYIVTGETKWADEYDKRRSSKKELLNQQGFTRNELNKVEQALKLSKDLMNIEDEAIHAVKGFYHDVNGGYKNKGVPNLDLAKRLMHNQIYQNFSTEFTKAVTDLKEILKARLEREIKKNKERIFIFQGMSVLMGLLMFLSAMLLNKYLRKAPAETESNQYFSEMIETMYAIKEENRTINESMFQAKQLFFNASVEAVKSGESGKDLLLVINEFEKLTEVSAKSATEISGILDKTLVSAVELSEGKKVA
ncbi:hypothetical protein DOM21_16775 [Bacteriovorax stolpii]|uniref:Uncharacterized protein n=1 Tax=Bacteriovorax stolpii TaxID=960 RepID=A0A2K9NN87_BACTC|nr:hypothetical protein [Bacteriovorax stolpii]AUN96991.1 hypothetical protein C0V70_02495 [Bacteriovorax stolpii]QDK43079.1 hypothetical protein DOM21_16775 [Bacteriovorax stolpii]TDP53277.1 hypothetical protein C8D79_1919 [Bacteriovorax stolpii]